MFVRINAVFMFVLLQVLAMPGWAEEEPEEGLSAIAEHMHSHLDQISLIKNAVIAGDLDAIRKPAVWLATHEIPKGLTGAWLPYVQEMRRYASRAAAAEDLVAAAGAISEIARTCGDCHRASGFSIAFGMDERPPADQQSLMTQMQRHLWAADRMWEGLIGPSDGAWNRGADILSEVNLVTSDIVGAGTKGASALENQAEISELLGRARDMGEMGGQATSVELRSGLYGQFLSSCASCHKLTGGGPGAR